MYIEREREICYLPLRRGGVEGQLDLLQGLEGRVDVLLMMDTYVYIYIYIYIYMYMIYAYTYIYIDIYKYVYMYISCIYIYIYIHIVYTCVYTYTYHNGGPCSRPPSTEQTLRLSYTINTHMIMLRTRSKRTSSSII